MRIGGLNWRMGAFVTEVRALIARFGEHEAEDAERFKSIDARFKGVVIHTAGIDPLEWWVPAGLQRYK